jgi:hypothetical protein
MAYKSDSMMFRDLDDAEEAEFRRWARYNWAEVLPANFEMFHPVIRDEWMRISEERHAEAQDQ